MGNWADDVTDKFMGVYWSGRYVCPMDRGHCPEHSIREMEDALVEIPMGDVERHIEKDPQITYVQILPRDPGYHMALMKAERHDDNYRKDEDGKVFRYQALIMGKKPGKFIKVGWRKTLCTLVERGAVAQKDVEKALSVRL